ncbi:hypothetical protein BH09PAT4_BH09PAT4_00710 [soil metagenome]
MLCSIQNEFGEVLDVFPMPRTGMSAEVVASELGALLSDIVGRNGVRDVPLHDSKTGQKQDRVVVDIDPWSGPQEAKLLRVYEAIGSLALPE